MAMLSAQTKVKIGDIEVKGLTNVPALNETKATLEVTALENTQRVYISGLKEPAESLEFTGYYEAASYKQLRDLAELGEEQDVEITLPDGVKISFTAEISVGLSEVTVGEAIQYTLALTPTGEFAFDFAGANIGA